MYKKEKRIRRKEKMGEEMISIDKYCEEGTVEKWEDVGFGEEFGSTWQSVVGGSI